MKRKPVKFKDAKGELDEVLHDEQNLILEKEPLIKQEELIEKEQHVDEDHYHGIHHFDKYGHHDDISKTEFSIKSQFPKSTKSLTFRIAMAAMILALSIAFSAVDSLMEKLTNIGGVQMEIRFLDILIIIIGLPMVGLFGSLGIAIVEPWFHWLIDGDHTPVQIALDSVGYSLTILVFFLVFYLLFRNSPIHKDPNKSKELFKEIIPGFVIVPVLSILFTVIFVIALYANKTSSDSDWEDFVKNSAALIFINFGIQIARFTVMYFVFVLVEKAMKPINHRYR